MKIGSLISLSLVTALVLGAAQAVPHADATAPPVTTKWVDDRDRERWTYTGAWTHASGEVWSVGNEGGTESFSRVPGARATIQFTGTSFDLVGPRGHNGGMFRVTVDCTAQHVVSSYSAVKQFGQNLLTVSGLPHGEHTVVIEVLGAPAQGSADKYVMIDGLRAHDGGSTDPTQRWMGSAGTSQQSGAIELRMPGCGASSSLLEQLKARTAGGWFGVPGAGSTWGAVNGHSVITPHGIAGGPITIGGLATPGASIPLAPGARVDMALSLPDAPRTALFRVLADERLGQAVSFAVAGADGMVLPTRVVTGSGAHLSERRLSEVFTLNPGEPTLVAVDLADAAGVGVNGSLTLIASSATGEPAELVILDGRTSHVSSAHIVRAFGVAPTGTPHAPIPFEYFRHGPVVLSRLLADVGAVAWTGDQTSTPGSAGAPVPLTFGENARGARLSVNGVAQPHDSIAIQLPPGEGSVSTVHLPLETGSQCRTLTASVGIDDSTPSRDAASISIAAYAGGALLPSQHNGTWAFAPHNGISEEFGERDTRTPVTMSAPRTDVANELRDAKLAMGARAFADDPASLAAFEALVNRQFEELSATIDDPSMSLMTYPIDGPLVLGAGSNALLAESTFTVEQDSVIGGSSRDVDITPIDLMDSFPLSIDLAEPRLMEMLRWAAQGTRIPFNQIQSPLASRVDLVLSGTPGAIVVLAGAGLDCVATDVSTRVFPMWSQVGVRPAFLPTPVDTKGEQLEWLVFNPLWWDTVCPAGVSNTTGIRFTVEKTRETVYAPTWSLEYAYTVSEVASSQRIACTLPADQRYVEFGDFAYKEGSYGPPTSDDYVQLSQEVRNPVDSQLLAIDGSLEDRAFDWLSTAAHATAEHEEEWVIWAVLLPLDLPVGLVLNPFVMDALPLSVSIPLGLAFMPFSAAEEVELGLASGAVSKASRPLESTNEVLFGTAEAHAVESAAGERLSLAVGETRLSVPVRTGADGEAIADIGSHTTSTTVVASDRAVSRMPVVSDHASWVTDEVVEYRAICPRGLNPQCTVPIGSEVVDAGGAHPDWLEPAATGAPHQAPSAHDASSFWTRHPQQAAQFQSEVHNPGGQWVNNNAALGWQSLQTDATLFNHGLGDAFMNELRVGETTFAPVAISTSTEPAYVFSRIPPDEVMEVGFTGSAEAWDDVAEGINPGVTNAWGARSPALIDDTVFVAATRDPNHLAAGLPLEDTDAAWYRYRIVRPQGGGIDLHASLNDPNAPHAVRQLGEDMVVRARADLLYFRIDPASISHVHEMEYINGRFVPVAGAPMPGFQNVVLDPIELAGAPAPAGQFFPAFDWWVPTPDDTDLALRVTAEHLPHDAPADHVVVFTKRSGWKSYAPGLGLTDQQLLDAGFVKGRWEATAYYPETREAWIPAPGIHLMEEGSAVIEVEPGWETTVGG